MTPTNSNHRDSNTTFDDYEPAKLKVTNPDTEKTDLSDVIKDYENSTLNRESINTESKQRKKNRILYLDLSRKSFNLLLLKVFNINNNIIWSLIFNLIKLKMRIMLSTESRKIYIFDCRADDVPTEISSLTLALTNKYEIVLTEQEFRIDPNTNYQIIVNGIYMTDNVNNLDYIPTMGDVSDNEITVALDDLNHGLFCQSNPILSIEINQFLSTKVDQLLWWYVVNREKKLFLINSTNSDLIPYLIKGLLAMNQYNFLLTDQGDYHKALVSLQCSNIGLNDNFVVIGPSTFK